MMMRCFRGLLVGLFFSVCANAANVVDVYGVSAKESAHIVKKYEKRIADVEATFYQKMQDAKGMLSDEPFKKMMEKRKDISHESMNDGGFAHVDMSTVYYPDNEILYTTIEVVDKHHPERLKFITKNKKIANSRNKHDLIDKMIEYSKLEMNLLFTNQLDINNISCPVYHCVSGFHHPKLKPYLMVFNKGASRNKKLIIDTLNQDANPERRAAAAFLVAHFKDPEEIIATLSPHVNDCDENVRNNVIRVMSGTIRKAKINLDITPFLALLDSPSVTDRNKSLSVILTASKSAAGKQQIIQTGVDRLLAILALKQPNNHDIAYEILKNISGNDFGEYNIAEWKTWLSKA